MNRPVAENTRPKVAIPYYGALSHPVRGLSHLYYLLEVNPENFAIVDTDISVWSPTSENDLCSWLIGNGVRALFCNQINPDQQKRLCLSGILIEADSNRDLFGSVARWLQDTGASLLNHDELAAQPA